MPRVRFIGSPNGYEGVGGSWTPGREKVVPQEFADYLIKDPAQFELVSDEEPASGKWDPAGSLEEPAAAESAVEERKTKPAPPGKKK